MVEDALSLHRPIAVREYSIPKPEEQNLPPVWPQLYLVENPTNRSPFNPPPAKREQQTTSSQSLKQKTANNSANIKRGNNTNTTMNTNNTNATNEINNNNKMNNNGNVPDLKQQASALIEKQDSHSHIRHVHVGNSIASGIVSFSIVSKRDAGEIVIPISQYAKEKDWKRKEISIVDNKKIAEQKAKLKSIQQQQQQRASTPKSTEKPHIRPPAFLHKPGYCENCTMKFQNFEEVKK